MEPIEISQPTFDANGGHDPSNKRRRLLIISLSAIFTALLVVAFIFLRKLQSPNAGSSDAREKVSAIDFMPDNDKDGDGLTDEREKELGTSDLEFDTDGDGLSDVLEINTWKTDPTNPDTDGDSFSDGYEVIRGFSPTEAAGT